MSAFSSNSLSFSISANPAQPPSTTTSMRLAANLLAFILALLVLRQTSPATRLRSMVFSFMMISQSQMSMTPLHLFSQMVLSSRLTTEVTPSTPLQLPWMLFLATRNFSQWSRNTPLPRAPQMWLLQMQLSMLLGPSRIRLQFTLPWISFFYRKMVAPPLTCTPLPKVAATQFRSMWGWQLDSTFMPTFWFSCSTLLQMSEMFREPQTSSPPFLFSASRLKRIKGQHSSFILEQLQIPQSRLPMRLFFITLGQLFSISMPTLHCLIQLLIRLLLLPNSVIIPNPVHSAITLFQTELLKGPLRTRPQPQLVIIEFLRMRLAEGPPFIHTPIPPWSLKEHSRMLTLPPLQYIPTVPRLPASSDLVMMSEPSSWTMMEAQRWRGSLTAAKESLHQSIWRVPRLTNMLVLMLSSTLQGRQRFSRTVLMLGHRSMLFTCQQVWANFNPSKQILSYFLGRSMMMVGLCSLIRTTLEVGSLDCILRPTVWIYRFSLQSPVFTLMMPSVEAIERALNTVGKQFFFLLVTSFWVKLESMRLTAGYSGSTQRGSVLSWKKLSNILTTALSLIMLPNLKTRLIIMTSRNRIMGYDSCWADQQECLHLYKK